MIHKYLDELPTKQELLCDYIFSLISPISNLSRDLKEKLIDAYKLSTNKEIKSATNLKKQQFLEIDVKYLDEIFNKFLNSKLSSKKFDSTLVPSIITQNRFKNRLPNKITCESNDKSYMLIEDILREGFPLTSGAVLYVFHIITPEKTKIKNIFINYYRYTENKLSFSFSINFENKIQKIYAIPNRDYLNTFLFIFLLSCVLSEFNDYIDINSIIVWKKARMEGSVFEISNIESLLNVLGSEPKRSNLIKFITYLYILRSILMGMGKNKEIIDSLLDKFCYYLIFKSNIDVFIINETVNQTVKLYKGSWIKNIDKRFIVKFLQEFGGDNMMEFFNLGQNIRRKIYAISNNDHNQAEKIIDRIAKDLRNEELPEYFIETFTKDIVWLKTKGLNNISSDLGTLIKKLIDEIHKSDLMRFYLIKSSVILGLLSPLSSSKEEGEYL